MLPSSDTPSRRFRPAAPVLVVAARGRKSTGAEADEAENRPFGSGLAALCRSIELSVVGMGGFCEQVAGETEALAALRRERPLLIAIAFSPERGASEELITGLRQRADLDDVPVLALLEKERDEDSARAYRAGASDILLSSATPEVVAAKLLSWLRLSARAYRLWALRDFAHEARHPIAAIGAAAHLLIISGEDPGERQRLCHAVVSESERLGRMVEGYLDADAADRIGDAPITENPLALLEDVLNVNLSRAVRSRVEVRTAGELPDLAVEPDHLRQMLINLLDNALNATAEIGRVTIETVADEAGAAISVRDTGSGISPEHMARIFDNGFSTRGDRRRGLGLGITQRLCARVGGRIVVNSHLGEGTVFVLWLPRPR